MKKVLFLSCDIDFCLADLSKVAEGALLTKRSPSAPLTPPSPSTFKVASKLAFKGMICLI